MKFFGISLRRLMIPLIVIDLALLIITFSIKSWIFGFVLYFNILLVFAAISSLIPYYMFKQTMDSTEYYKTIIDVGYTFLDEGLLFKFFEMRITNMRNSIFAYLAIWLTLFLASVTNYKKLYDYLGNPITTTVLVILIGMAVGLFFFASIGIDRETIKEFKELLKAKEYLIKKRNEKL